MTTVSELFWRTELPKRFAEVTKEGKILHNYNLCMKEM